MVLRKHRYVAALVASVVLLLALAGGVIAQTEGQFGVYVQDGASLLDYQTKQLLYSHAVWINKRTGTAQVGIVTVPALDSQTLEDLAVATFRKLGLGSKEKNDGVLLLYTAKENHVRIEVGYGLEGRIPDGKAGAILDTYFIPNMKAGDINKAFTLTQGALIQEVAAEYGVDTSELGELPAPSYVGQGNQDFLAGMPGYVKILLLIGVVILIVLDFTFTGGMITMSLLSMLRRGGSSGGGGWGGGRGGGGSSGGGGASR